MKNKYPESSKLYFLFIRFEEKGYTSIGFHLENGNRLCVELKNFQPFYFNLDEYKMGKAIFRGEERFAYPDYCNLLSIAEFVWKHRDALHDELDVQ